MEFRSCLFDSYTFFSNYTPIKKFLPHEMNRDKTLKFHFLYFKHDLRHLYEIHFIGSWAGWDKKLGKIKFFFSVLASLFTWDIQKRKKKDLITAFNSRLEHFFLLKENTFKIYCLSCMRIYARLIFTHAL